MIQVLKIEHQQKVISPHLSQYEQIKSEVDDQYRVPRGLAKLQTIQELADRELTR